MHTSPPLWQKSLAEAVTQPLELLALLNLTPEQLPHTLDLKPNFPLRVPRGFIARMETGNPHDPLLRQVLSTQNEQMIHPAFNQDPLNELAITRIPGLLHKYQGRVLITTTGACGVHCRYCFRQHYPYSDNQLTSERWDNIKTYLQQDASIHEVILSGGDPLTLSDRRLLAIATDLATISHIKTLRIHSRMPIIIPERMTDELLMSLHTRLRTVLVIHANHAQEIDMTVQQALQPFRTAGITLLNQSVLLTGINDSVDVLVALSEALFSAGILPYYLHLLDKTQGTAHFEVAQAQAQTLWWAMAKQLPGYLVPRLVYAASDAPMKLSGLL